MTETRALFEISGTDADHFLQGLATNDVARLADGLVYSAILTPQGKYLADFFLARRGDGIILDVAEEIAQSLAMRLNMYKLRADVKITPLALHVHRGTGEVPEDGFADPRDPSLGWRAYRDTPQEDAGIDWDALRVAACVPETGIELTSDSYILEAGFERLHGVDFRKGCYVGQEVTARMKHKTELRKGLAKVKVEGAAPVGTEITRDGRVVGTLFTQSGGAGIAYLRFDRTGVDMVAGDAKVSWAP
ncbi:CAF17-like 4Fe-4S cluster assembly/insertion protein YgfZ [Shimia sediminis]|uniref:CAF17-like 4Fe-4S cluster assembly/insertion protein YgfZ n=1 Tax=Shimia sediminis TaxID=2497945 RepID=UPI000F8EAAC9|nr:folate-binding protein YgfZ [Shimia sediminis]